MGGGPNAFWNELSLPNEGESIACWVTGGTPNTAKNKNITKDMQKLHTNSTKKIIHQTKPKNMCYSYKTTKAIQSCLIAQCKRVLLTVSVGEFCGEWSIVGGRCGGAAVGAAARVQHGGEGVGPGQLQEVVGSLVRTSRCSTLNASANVMHGQLFFN